MQNGTFFNRNVYELHAFTLPKTPPYAYEKLKAQYPVLQYFSAPHDLLAFLHNRENPDYAANDEILFSLIQDYNLSRSMSLACLLLHIFTPGLEAIFHHYKNRVTAFSHTDSDDLQMHILLFFLETLNAYETHNIAYKVASKIIGTVRNKMKRWYVHELRELKIKIYLQQITRPAASSRPRAKSSHGLGFYS